MSIHDVVTNHAERVYGTASAFGNGQTLRQRLNDLVTEAVKEALDAYKARVLEAALECQVNENWCDEGLHAALRSLDIEPPKREWEVSVEVKAFQSVTVRVEAATEDEAMERANGMNWGDVMERAAGGTWSHDAHEAEEAWVA